MGAHPCLLHGLIQRRREERRQAGVKARAPRRRGTVLHCGPREPRWRFCRLGWRVRSCSTDAVAVRSSPFKVQVRRALVGAPATATSAPIIERRRACAAAPHCRGGAPVPRIWRGASRMLPRIAITTCGGGRASAWSLLRASGGAPLHATCIDCRGARARARCSGQVCAALRLVARASAEQALGRPRARERALVAVRVRSARWRRVARGSVARTRTLVTSNTLQVRVLAKPRATGATNAENARAQELASLSELARREAAPKALPSLSRRLRRHVIFGKLRWWRVPGRERPRSRVFARVALLTECPLATAR